MPVGFLIIYTKGVIMETDQAKLSSNRSVPHIEQHVAKHTVVVSYDFVISFNDCLVFSF